MRKAALRLIRNLPEARPANETSPSCHLRRDLVLLRPQLYQVALSLTRDASLADDLVQDVMEKALCNRGRFETGAKLLAWAKTVMRNAFFDRYRHERLQVPLPFEVALQDEDPMEDPADLITVDDVIAALPRLRPNDRLVVERALFDRRSYREIADELGVRINTVATRLARARGRLRAVLLRVYDDRLRQVQLAATSPATSEEMEAT